MEFVVPIRKGGLGNQMFQVAAALVVSKKYNKTIFLPGEMPHIHNPLGNVYEDTIFSFVEHRLNTPSYTNTMLVLHRAGFKIYPEEPGFEAWDPSVAKSCSIVLHGYFQHYPILQPFEDLIRHYYLKGLTEFLKGQSPDHTCVGIHVRRGDYLLPPFNEVHVFPGEQYYKDAIEKIPCKQSYKIFSDDIAWCKEQDFFKSLPNVIFVEEPNELKALAQMTLCHGGFICANSTFSWWGAFLGAYEVRAPVIVPKLWIKGQDTSSLFPTEWIQL